MFSLCNMHVLFYVPGKDTPNIHVIILLRFARFIGEESTAEGKKVEWMDAPTWIIDPIDGTANFVHSIPQTCVCIGLSINKQVNVCVSLSINKQVNVCISVSINKQVNVCCVCLSTYG
jgi:hypothetical protein